ncbi:MAG: hypothetical protein BWX81_02182 [Spirochaetes bacterium ADurb.Bin110]|nr:MAG: hypothetical protein BWX81_02182 [Spirochaetes bacterium ADurb.Bin110]
MKKPFLVENVADSGCVNSLVALDHLSLPNFFLSHDILLQSS